MTGIIVIISSTGGQSRLESVKHKKLTNVLLKAKVETSTMFDV
jgi:hypothetical protein